MDERYEWLSRLKANSWSIEVNEHACNYCTAKQWIEDYSPHMFEGVPAELIEGMKNANVIYRLQIYPDTPIGFHWWCGPTLDSVIEQAMRAHSAPEAP